MTGHDVHGSAARPELAAVRGRELGARAPPVRAFPAFNFAVEIEGLLLGGCSEVSGLESRVETEEYREGGVNGFAHRLPGVASQSNLVLSRGLTANSVMWNWHYNAVRGVIHRKNGTLMLLDAAPDPGHVVELPQRPAGALDRPRLRRARRPGRRSSRSNWRTKG